jgi:hypothetical protein
MLLLAPACARREVATGQWTGVARPDAAMSAGDPARDVSPGISKSVDAAPPPPPAAEGGVPGAGAEFGPADAAPGGRAAEVGPSNPVLPHADASADVGDARTCPETGQCD